MDDIIVRATEPSDAEAIHRIVNSPKAQSGTLQMPFQSLEAVRERIAAGRDDLYRLVAEVNGDVVGLAGLHLEINPRRRHVGSIGMMVRDDWQGKGVGRKLLAGLLDLADNWLNLHRLELDVYTDNAAGIHLYESNGFVIEGTRPDFAFRDGAYVSAYCMGRVRGGS